MMSLLQKMNADLVERAGWTLLHSIWQIGLLSLVYGAVILTVRRSASIRYVTGCVVLALMMVVPGVTFVVQSSDVTTASVRANADTTVNPHVIPPKSQKPPTDAAADSTLSSSQTSLDTNDSDSSDRSSGRQIAHRLLDDATTNEATSSRSTSENSVADAGNSTSIIAQIHAVVAGHLEPWMPHICAGWCCGVLMLWLRLAFGAYIVRRLRLNGQSPVPKHVQALFDSLVERTNVRRAVRIAQSTLVQIPSVVGVLRPVVLLPITAVTGLSSDQLEVVLAHELAHVRRFDFLANVLQTVVESLLFYHPCMWWVSCSLRREREHCCDDIALSFCSNRGHYARTLLAVEELCGSAPQMLVAANGGSLVRRIRRIVGTETSHSPTHGVALFATALLVIGATTFVIAQGSSEDRSRGLPALDKRPDTRKVEAESNVRKDWETFIDHLNSARYQQAAVFVKAESVSPDELSAEFRRRTQAIPRLAEAWRDRFGSLDVLKTVHDLHVGDRLAAVVTKARRINGPATRLVIVLERRADRWQIRQTDDYNEELPLDRFVAMIEDELVAQEQETSFATSKNAIENEPVDATDTTRADHDSPQPPVGQTIDVTLGTIDPELREFGSLDVERGLTLQTPAFPSDPESDFNNKRHGVWKWALRQGVDFVGDYETGLHAIVQTIARLDDKKTFDEVTREAAARQLNIQTDKRSWTTLIPRSSRASFVFRTHHGAIGVVRITDADAQKRQLKTRFRLLSRAETETPRAVVTQWMNTIRNLDNIQPTWGLATPDVSTLSAVDQVNRHLWNRFQLRTEFAVGDSKTQLVMTNVIRDNSGRDRVLVFQTMKSQDQWLINEAELYAPDEAQKLVSGFMKNPDMVWDVRERDVIGEWVHQFFVLTAYISIRSDHTLVERHEGKQRTGNWQLKGNKLLFSFEGGDPYPLTVTRLGPDFFSFTNPEGSLSTFRRQKEAVGTEQPAQKVTLTDFDEADTFEVLDLDSGKLIKASGRTDQWTDEMKRGDLAVEFAKNRWHLGTRNMTVAKLPEPFWDRPPGRELQKKLREALAFPGPFPTTESDGLTFHSLPQPLQFPTVIGFLTNDGTAGLLKIVGSLDSPKRLIIEYRQVARNQDRPLTSETVATDSGRKDREEALAWLTREAFGANTDAAKDAAFTFAMMELHEKTLERLPTLLSQESPLDRLSFDDALSQLEEASRILPLLQANAVNLHRKKPLSGARLLIATRLLNALLQPVPTKRSEKRAEAKVNQQTPAGPTEVKVRSNPELIDPSESVVLDPNHLWRTSHCAVGQHTDYVWEERGGDRKFPTFSVGEPLRRHVWNHIEFMPIDHERYPLLVLTYRAENLSKNDRAFDYILWFSDEQARGGEGKGIHAVMNSDLIDDGKLRELVVDLRNMNPRGFDRIRGSLDDLWLGVKAGPNATGESPARFEFVGLRFEADDSATHAAIQNDELIKVRVVDFHGRPVNGAKVTVDAQRINFARSAVTDATGRASVAPLKNHVGRHMLRVEKEGWCTEEIPNATEAIENPGGGFLSALGIEQAGADEVRVVLHRAQRLTGKVQNENGEPIANVSVEMFVPALDNLHPGAAEILNKVQLRTDENGIWKSPPLSSNGASIDIRLSHPNYIDDSRSRDFPTDDVSLQVIRNGELVLTMHRGATLSAKVLTSDGTPAAGASILVQTDHGQARGFVNDEGRLEIYGVPTGSFQMLVTRNGDAPELIEQTAEPSTNSLVDIALSKGRKVTGRAIDSAGEPVAGARIEVVAWRKRRILKRSVKSKADGTWALNNVPLDEFTIRAKLGGKTCEVHTVPPDADNITLQLEP